MPYLALIDRLRTFLRKPSAVLVVCGYSFRDDHINEVITQALQSNPGLMIFALMYGELARYAKAQRIAETRGNISLLALDQAVIGRRAGPWRPAEPAEIVDGYAPAIDIGNANGATSLRFALGDFQKFGLFLDTIVGVNTSQATV